VYLSLQILKRTPTLVVREVTQNTNIEEIAPSHSSTFVKQRKLLTTSSTWSNNYFLFIYLFTVLSLKLL